MWSKLTLNGGVALITGAASGIGRETAFAFAEAGVTGIAFADINEPEAEKAAKESEMYATHEEYTHLVIKVDVTVEESVEKMVEATIKKFGRIDYNVNSAGMGNTEGDVLPELKTDFFSRVMDLNVKGMFLCNRAVAKVMEKQEPLKYKSRRYGERSLGRGSIVNLGSVNSYLAVEKMLAYTTSKHAVVGMTKSAALDCAKHGIRVNAVCPSWVDTPMLQAAIGRRPELADLIKIGSPLHRVAKPEEVADYVVFLCSPSASYVSGTGLTIDSGLTLTVHAP